MIPTLNIFQGFGIIFGFILVVVGLILIAGTIVEKEAEGEINSSVDFREAILRNYNKIGLIILFIGILLIIFSFPSSWQEKKQFVKEIFQSFTY